MKIYFAGSIRGGREDAEFYSALIAHLRSHGEVLTEHVGDGKVLEFGEAGKSDDCIHDRDLAWVMESDVVIAEVTTPSLGVGYEIGRAVENSKKVLCLHRPLEGKMLSAMIAGCPQVKNAQYSNLREAKRIIDRFLAEIKK